MAHTTWSLILPTWALLVVTLQGCSSVSPLADGLAGDLARDARADADAGRDPLTPPDDGPGPLDRATDPELDAADLADVPPSDRAPDQTPPVDLVQDAGDAADGGADLIPACPPVAPTGYELVEVAGGLNVPVFITLVPGDRSRIFIVEQFGIIQLIKDGVRQTPFLELSTANPQEFSAGSERGLFSLAFHPGFGQGGEDRFYVNYTELGGDVVVDEWRLLAGNPDRFDPATRRRVITIEHSEHPNHNGGTLAFGPDGLLYLSVGDGGFRDDPYDAGQNLGTHLGKILRIDVDRTDPGLQYGVPQENPFVLAPAGALPEIWALGLRNPWRFSFDLPTGTLIVGDVGQGTAEEIDVLHLDQPGANLGWSCREGTRSFRPEQCPAAGSPVGTLTEPVFDYVHDAPRCSVTGGVVYRGCGVPELRGRYFFADFCTSEIFSLAFDAQGGTSDFRVHDELAGFVVGGLSTFGTDHDGELLVADYGSGFVYRLAPLP